jgi:TonB-linked SusC/RagA family outer membrane protein
MRYFNKAMLVASAALCLNLSVFSQNITLKTGNVTVKEAMEQLKKSSGYSFVFSSVDVNTQKRVSVSVQNASIEEAVKQILAGQQGLNYEVKGKKIIVQKKAQSSNVRKISGRVVDANNEPIIGASIQVEGTEIGTISDFDGNFTLEAAEGNTLVFSFIGYKKQYIEVKRQKSLSVVMREDSEMLDDVVVIGYGTVSKKELTSAVSHISSKDLLQIGSGNPAMQMQGKVSGLAVENSTPSDPNSSPSIQVRGVSSRSAGLGPLIVIDGVPGGSLDNVNENDIESIDVLKDGAASAIYGTRGSNGVIVITTKKGSTDGQIHTAYSGFVNITTPIRELNVLSADEFRKYNRGEDYGANTDWFDELTKVAVSHSHTLQVMGGNSKNNYKATVDYKNTEGIDLRSGREQLGARLSLNHTGKNDLYNVVLNVAPRVINYQDSDYDTFRSALMINPTTPVMDPNNPGYYTKITTYSTNNPVEILKLEQSGGEQTILSWDGTFKLNLLPLFSTNKNHYLSTQITLAQQIIETDYSWFRPSTSTIEQDNGFSGEASRKYDKNKQESLEWLVNYGYDTNNHHLKFMGGYSYQYFVNDGLNAENKNFASDILGPNNLGSGTYNSDEIGRLGMGSYKNDAKLIAFFGRLSYNYKDKYFATFSLRHEGSSKFGANHKWGSFPAVSAGWRISEEDFMKDVKWISDLKLRGDFGVTGNQDFDSYKSLALMSSYDLIYYQGSYIKGWGSSSNPNPDLRWEKGKNWNIGLDFSLFNYRLSGSINYYHRKQQDLLGTYDVPQPPYAHPTTFVNVGTMKNTGVEIELNWNAVHTKDFDYTIGFVGSTSDNKFVSFSNDTYEGQSFYWLSGFPLYPGNPGALQRIEEGERIGNFYTFEYAGVDEEGGWLIYSKDGQKIPIAEGTDEDKKVVGNGLPKFSMSMTHAFRYKNFDLNLYFRGNFGYQIYDAQDLYYGLQNAAPNTNVLESAYNENQHITGTNVHSSYFVHNGNFLKLDVATLGYTWNCGSKWLEKARFYITGRNLFTISGYHRGLDKDAYCVNGMEPGVPYSKNGYYPSSRQFLFGVQLNF